MDRLAHKRSTSSRRTHRVRRNIIGSAERPRLSVFISNTHVSAQLIDDNSGKTLFYATTVGKKAAGSMSDKAALVGEDIAKQAKQAKISQVVFDRGPKKYHGRVKVLADAARAQGLEF